MNTHPIRLLATLMIALTASVIALSMAQRVEAGFSRKLSTVAVAPPQQPAPPLLSNIQAIGAGYQHTCALTMDGGVKCWGKNEYGQLGDGTTIERWTPVDVQGLGNGVQAIAVGIYHTCALTTSGGVKCWGGNSDGQLGDGTTTIRWTPVDVSELTSSVQAVVAGTFHTCALTARGGVKCWGRNDYGQLGDGTSTSHWAPVDVSGLTSGVQAVAAGILHSCALTAGGGVKCWGWNDSGQLGDGTILSRSTPVDVTGLTSGAQSVTAGSINTCALTGDGGVKCWGRNNEGQLGDGTATSRWIPVDVTGLASGVQSVAAGSFHTCALTPGGNVKCWGDNSYGQLGDGTTTARWTPMDVIELASGVQSVASGGSHTCALTAGGNVKCWGSNSYGQLGDGMTTARWTPLDVIELTSGVQSVASGGSHTCALTAAGGVKCWGNNLHGQLGDGTTTARWTPMDVIELVSGVQSVASGGSHTCVLTAGGGAKCWGKNNDGQLGDGTTTARWTPVDVTGMISGVQSITANSSHSCALTAGGGVKCWGSNSYGQLGDGTTTARWAPVDVTGLISGVQTIVAGSLHTCALTTEGGVKCWGNNLYGQLGNGTTSARLTPGDVTGLTSGVQAIAAGIFHTCALMAGGGVKCWGDNLAGQLGNGTTSARLTPGDVTGLTSGVQSVAVGGSHTCALTAGGVVKCWGSNSSGQLSVNPGWTPVDVINPSANVDAAVLSSQMLYPTVAPNTSLHLWINVRNSGTSTWRFADGYQWRGTGELEGQTSQVVGPISPNETWPFTANIVAPSQPGTYIYGFVLQHNNVDFGPHFFIQVNVESSVSLPDYKVNEDGYNFKNDGSIKISSLSLARIHDIFGDSACWSGVGPLCVPKNEVVEWVNKSISEMREVGLCLGMSVTSLRFNDGNLEQPGQFQWFATKTYDLSSTNSAVAEHLYDYSIRQLTSVVTGRIAPFKDPTIERVLDLIGQGFTDGNPMVVAITDNEGGGHTMVPYRIRRLGQDDARIYVYDPGYASDGKDHFIEVHPQSGTWQYEFSPGKLWSNELYAFPASTQQGPLGWGQPASVTSTNADDVQLASVYVSPGVILQNLDGAPLDSMPVLAGGLGPSSRIYYFPEAQQHNLTVDRTGITDSQGSIVYMGPAGLMMVEGLTSAPVSDTLTLNNGDNSLVYSPGASSVLTVTRSAVNEFKDVLVKTKDLQLGAQATFTVAVDVGQVFVALNSSTPASYDLDLSVHSTDALNQHFVSSDVPISPSTTQLIGVPALIGASIPITTAVMGTGEITIGTLDNESTGNGSVFLPHVSR